MSGAGPGEITEDAVCGACGYSLAGLPRDGNCPECGRPVWHSSRRTPLWTAPVATLRSLYWGAVLSETAPAVAALLLLAGAALGRRMTLPTAAATGPALIVQTAIGWWLLLSTSTHWRRPSPRPGLTRASRLGLLLLVVGAGCVWTLLRMSDRFASYELAIGLGLAAAVVVWGACLVVFRCIRQAGIDLHDESLRSGAEVGAWLMLPGPLLLLGWVVLMGHIAVRAPTFRVLSESWAAAISLAAMLWLGSGAVVYLSVLNRLRLLAGRAYRLRR